MTETTEKMDETTVSEATPEEGAAAEEKAAAEDVEQEEGAGAPAAEPDPLLVMEEKLAQAEASLKDANDRMLRSSAELENFKKRTARETEEFRKYANEAFVKQLLPVLDNLERAVDSAGTCETGDTIVEGVRMTLSEIASVFEKFHIKAVDAADKPFDPAFHMAVAQEETDAVAPNTVLNVFQAGYVMHDRLIRPAMVSVSKAKPAKAKPEDGEA